MFKISLARRRLPDPIPGEAISSRGKVSSGGEHGEIVAGSVATQVGDAMEK